MLRKFLVIGLFLPFSSAIFSQTAGSKEITLNQAINYNEKIIQVSFNGDDSSFGEFRITSENGEEIWFIKEAELISSPNYFAVPIESIESGKYTFTVKTEKGFYSTVYTIQ